MLAPQFRDSVPARDSADGHNVHRLARAHDVRAPEPIELDSAQLLRGQRELQIRHGNEVYRLRHTRNDKLILTK
ncbi:hemin uptake protein HemP [Luteimonas sp. TWI1416]|uniref:hemin uptake protein HemP n=1 Tax=unclassified Luteimonas TaxID=2629088 RepID=UPI00320B7BB3